MLESPNRLIQLCMLLICIHVYGTLCAQILSEPLTHSDQIWYDVSWYVSSLARKSCIAISLDDLIAKVKVTMTE